MGTDGVEALNVHQAGVHHAGDGADGCAVEGEPSCLVVKEEEGWEGETLGPVRKGGGKEHQQFLGEEMVLRRRGVGRAQCSRNRGYQDSFVLAQKLARSLNLLKSYILPVEINLNMVFLFGSNLKKSKQIKLL